MAKDISYRDGDVIISDGDFLLLEADDSRTGYAQHAVDILLDSPGQWYQSPLIGVGISDSINGKNDPFLKSRIVKNLRDDNFKINQIIVNFVGNRLDLTVNVNK